MPIPVIDALMRNSKALVTICVAVLLFALLPLFLSIISFNKKRSKLPPSLPRLPIIGNLHQLGLTPHKKLALLAKEHGSLILLKLGSVSTLFVCSAVSAKQIVKSHDVVFSSRPRMALFEMLFYDRKDVATSPYNEHWRQLRSLAVIQLLSNKRVRDFKNIREEEMMITMEEIEKNSCRGSAFDLTQLIVCLVCNITCRMAFGRKYDDVDDDRNALKFKGMMDDFTRMGGTLNIGDFIPWLSWLNYINGYYFKVKRLSQRLDWVLERIIDDHIIKGPITDGEAHKDVVDVLLEIQERHNESGEGMTLSMDSIKGVLLDMFTAGVETTSTTIEWAMAELIKHPKIMSNAQKEVRSIVGSKDHVTEDDAAKMTYIKAVIKETFRLNPPLALLFPRETTSDVKVHGYDIPAKTRVFFNAWAMGRDPDSWERPDEFDPERFLKDDAISARDYKGQDFELIPFGVGRRACPGMYFSVHMIELALANLLHKFNWSLPDGQKVEELDMSENIGVTITKKYSLVVVATTANNTP